ncbi:MAG TPA: TolC family protein [Bacteroidetes bacterium]|nr:TolC family protein [Bacteroidota bacterium]
MKLNKRNLLISLLVFLTGFIQAQEVRYFSLQEALDYAMNNNYQVILSGKNIEAAKARVLESTAIGLPQIDGKVTYDDNFARPTFIFPSFTPGGKEMEIKMGTNYNASFGASLNQLLFSGQYLVGLKAAKKYLEKTTADFFKDKLAIKQQVADSYYNILSTEAALDIVDTTYLLTKVLADETRQIYKVGFAEDIDVDQLDLLVSDLEASRVFLDNQRGIAYAFLKFYLGLSENDSIVLTDDMQSLVEKSKKSLILSQTFKYSQNADYISLNKQKELTLLQVNLAKSAYMPTLAARVNYQTQAQRNSWDFFSSEGKWYQSGALGITLDVPILSSGQRKAKVKQAKIAFEQVEISEKQLVTTLNLQYQTAKNEYLNAYRVYQNKDKARKIADKIFTKTSVKFKEGMSSSLDILNTQTQYLKAEQDFITASLTLLKAGEDLKKLLTNAINP